MTDLRSTIAPRSDQLNSDDLIAGPRTIKVTKVLLTSEADQPVAIHFEGDNGKPYKACKSMRRVLVQIWGPDGATFAGKSMTLYRDPQVQFGGMAVGGIRISHMSHIDKPITMALTVTRANRKPFTVKPLAAGEKAPEPPAWEQEAAKAALGGTASFTAFWNGPGKQYREQLRPKIDEFKKVAANADAAAKQSNAAPADDDPFGLPPPVETVTLSEEAQQAIETLQACTSEAEVDAAWERFSFEVCREIGMPTLEQHKARCSASQAAE